MRALERNKVTLYYANYTGKTPIIDDNGLNTGEYLLAYSDPIEIRANVSAATGNNSTDLFGVNVDCDKIIVLAEPALDIADTSVLWIDESDTAQPYDYIVKRIARSLNSISIAVKRVKVM